MNPSAISKVWPWLLAMVCTLAVCAVLYTFVFGPARILSAYEDDCRRVAAPRGHALRHAEGLRIASDVPGMMGNDVADAQVLLVKKRFLFVEIAPPARHDRGPVDAMPRRYFLAARHDPACVADLYPWAARIESEAGVPGRLCLASEPAGDSLAGYGLHRETLVTRRGFKAWRFVLTVGAGKRPLGGSGDVVWPNRTRWSSPTCRTHLGDTALWRSAPENPVDWVTATNEGAWFRRKRIPADSDVARFYRAMDVSSTRREAPDPQSAAR
ncbi:MAG: hypothetical protein ACTHOH_15255 [Lysobacteraceae bacterium]